ncbi:MAG: ABC transporter permease [Candidatus Promineifilaceae bacterium]|nr:ABC transporter permease [Candidatus Promineifilaceae bacterium]
MSRYLLKRLLSGIVAFLIFTAIVFFGFNLLLPFDYVTTLSLFLPGNEAREALREELGLNLPLWRQYFLWLGHLVQGDFGQEFSMGGGGRSVTEILKHTLPPTLLVFATGSGLAFVVGHWLGKVSGWRASRWLSGSLTLGSIAAYTAFPPWLAFLLTFVLVDWLGVFPFGATRLRDGLWRDAPIDSNTLMIRMTLVVWGVAAAVWLINWVSRRWRRRNLPSILSIALFVGGLGLAWWLSEYGPYISDIARVAVIPFVTFVLLAFGDTLLIMQANMLDTQHELYIQTARAKGLSEKEVRDRHAGRNALLPALSRFVVNMPYLLTAIVIIEHATEWNGIGNLLFGSIYNQNTYVYMGVLVIVGLVALVARLALDVIYAALDPRIRYGGREKGSVQ